MLDQLEAIIRDRQRKPKAGSYTNRLLDEGRGKIAQKVGEEAVEVVVAALTQSKSQQIDELADLIYHTLVLMADLDVSLDDLRAKLRERHQPR
ncbi:MAG: phosphoribosyl-ATP diphosphatase [Chloroflexota bacterium]|nr:phosphoribosyl-ATP diphosphatase [Chloroflexota bacterium]MDE2947061.1 phosphoribosyl-ATP diphosphatase [Chloroflexota bacterium]